MNLVFNLLSKILLSNLRLDNKPYKLTYVVTYKCNSRCKICNIWKKPNHPELTTGEIKQFFSNNRYFNWIDLTGGEVFLRTDLVDIIRVINNTQPLYALHIPTNGIMTKKIVNDVKQILDLKLNHFILSVSLDGPPKKHNQLRGIPNNWTYAINTFRQLRKYKSRNFDCYISMTLSSYNQELIEKTYQSILNKIPDFSRNEMHFNLAHHSAHYYANNQITIGSAKEIIVNLEKFNSKKQISLNKISIMDKIYQKLLNKYLKSNQSPIPCMAVRSSIFLDPYGDVYPCSMWGYKLGNIKKYDYSIAKILKQDITKKVIKNISEYNCPNCWTPCEAYQSILGNLIRSL